MKYRFVKDAHECESIDGCVFVNNVFETDDIAIAERMRRSYPFGKTVREAFDNPQKNKYSRMQYSELVALAKELGVDSTGNRQTIIERLLEYDNEYQ